MEKKQDELMAEAKALGLEPHHSTGVLKLEKMIEDKKLEDYDAEMTGDEQFDKAYDIPRELTKSERKTALRQIQKRLLRVIVRCNNELKKEKTGEYFTIVCAAGTIKRWVPFDNENGWHVEQAILDVMQAKLCQKFKNTTLKNGQTHRIPFTVKEYSIEFLPSMSQEELQKLADEQDARGSIDK